MTTVGNKRPKATADATQAIPRVASSAAREDLICSAPEIIRGCSSARMARMKAGRELRRSMLNPNFIVLCRKI